MGILPLGWSGFPAPRQGNTPSLLSIFLRPGIVELGKTEKVGRVEYTGIAGAELFGHLEDRSWWPLALLPFSSKGGQ